MNTDTNEANDLHYDNLEAIRNEAIRSKAAKEYWYAKFKYEQKRPSELIVAATAYETDENNQYVAQAFIDGAQWQMQQKK
jgi:hypothetical protein